MSDLNFEGKRVLVVGGSSGIGNGIAHGFRNAERKSMPGAHVRQLRTIPVPRDLILMACTTPRSTSQTTMS